MNKMNKKNTVIKILLWIIILFNISFLLLHQNYASTIADVISCIILGAAILCQFEVHTFSQPSFRIRKKNNNAQNRRMV